MSTMSLALRDSTTMLRRDLRHCVRFPMMTMSGILVPVIFLLCSPASSVVLCTRASAPTPPAQAATSTT